MSEVCSPNEKEPCPNSAQADSPWLKEAHPPVPGQSVSPGQGDHTPRGLATDTKDIKPNSLTVSTQDKVDPISGTIEAEHLIDQAQKLLTKNPENILSRNYQQLLQKAIIAADRQLKLDTETTIALHASTDKNSLQQQSNKLLAERHVSVMARAFLAESYHDQGQNDKADKLIHEAIFDIGGTPQEINGSAQDLVKSLEQQGVEPPVAFKSAIRIFVLAENIADQSSKEALQILSNTDPQTSNSQITQAEKDHLVLVAMSPIETRWFHAQAEYNADPNDPVYKDVATNYIHQAQDKLDELENQINYVSPGLMGETPLWENPLTWVTPDFRQPIAVYKQLNSGTLNQIEQGDQAISFNDAGYSSADLNNGQQSLCDGLAFTAGFGGGVGLSILATPDTLGIGTAPAFLAGRAIAGSLAYNVCRAYFGKPIRAGSIAWGGIDGLSGGLDSYFLRAGGELGAIALLRGSVPGALTYSSAYAANDYLSGADKYSITISFGTNLATSLAAPIVLMRPVLGVGIASSILLTGDSPAPQQKDKSK